MAEAIKMSCPVCNGKRHYIREDEEENRKYSCANFDCSLYNVSLTEEALLTLGKQRQELQQLKAKLARYQDPTSNLCDEWIKKQTEGEQ